MAGSNPLTRRPLSLPRLSEVRKQEEPPPPLVTDPEQRSFLLSWLLEDRLQRPAGTRGGNVGRAHSGTGGTSSE